MTRSFHLSCLAASVLAVLWNAPAQALELHVEPPAPTLHGDRTVFAAEPSDASGEALLRWDFGDGTVTEFSADNTGLEHTFDAPGHYRVTIVAQDDGGFASHSFIHTVHTAPTPRAPQTSGSLLVDPERGLVVTANTDNGTVTLVDLDALEKVAEIEVFRDPVAVALAPDGRLWVVHRDVYAVAIVDLDARRAVDFFRLPYASLPMGIVFGAEGDAYIPLMALGDVVRIDGTTHEIVAQEHVAPFLRGITISGDGASLWVTRFISQGDRGEVYRLDAASLDTVARFDLAEDTTTEDSDVQGRGLPNYLFSVTVTPDGRQAWVPSKKDNMARGLMRDGQALTQDNAVRPLVSILDLTTDEERLEARLDLDDRNLPYHVAFTPLGDWAFVSVFGSNLVELRDAYDRTFVTALRGDALLGPVASIVAPRDRLLVLADLARTLVVYDVAALLAGSDQSTRILAEVPLVADEKLPSVLLQGKRIFANAEDKRMASEGYLSCSSCHFDGFEDGMIWDFFDRGEGFRNTISLLGRRGTGHGPVHWSANFDEIQDFDNPIRAHQGGLGFIPLDVFESGTVSDPWGDPKAGLDSDLDALAAYVASLDAVPRSPYRNPDGTLTAQAEEGFALFLELGCDTCHAGADFTDSLDGGVHDVGTLTELSGDRLGGELLGIDTPTLLGIWQTAPYLHDGSAPTLHDVLTTRNPEGRHGATADLSEDELDALVAYLLQIDGDVPPEELRLPEEPPTDDGTGGEDEGSSSSGSEDEGGSAMGEPGTTSSTGAQASTGVGEASSEAAESGSSTAPQDGGAATDGGCSCRATAPVGGRSAGLWMLLLFALRRPTRRCVAR